MTDPALMLGVALVMTSYWKCIGSEGESARGDICFHRACDWPAGQGPIGAILPGMSIAVWMMLRRKWAETWRRIPWITGSVLLLLLVLPWYGVAEYRTPGFLRYFIIGEHIDRFCCRTGPATCMASAVHGHGARSGCSGFLPRCHGRDFYWLLCSIVRRAHT